MSAFSLALSRRIPPPLPSYKLMSSYLRLAGCARVCLHVGAPVDLKPLVEDFNRRHPNLRLGSGPDALAAALAPRTAGRTRDGGGDRSGEAGGAEVEEAGPGVCPHRRELYRAITEKIRSAVLECRAKAAAEQRALLALDDIKSEATGPAQAGKCTDTAK